MIHAGIKEVKNNLSRFLCQVKAGNEVMITERGKPIARIIKEDSTRGGIRKAFKPLIESGSIVLPSNRLRKEQLLCYKVSGKAASDMVIEDRR